jgi:hypothetical protein
MGSDSDEKMLSQDVSLSSAESAFDRRRSYPRKHAVSEISAILDSEDSRKTLHCIELNDEEPN